MYVMYSLTDKPTNEREVNELKNGPSQHYLFKLKPKSCKVDSTFSFILIFAPLGSANKRSMCFFKCKPAIQKF